MSILQVEFDVGLLECMDAPQILRDYCSEEAIVSVTIQGKENSGLGQGGYSEAV